MVEWGQKVAEVRREGPYTEDFDFPEGTIVEVSLFRALDYFVNETDVMNQTIQTLRDQGQIPVYCKAWKDWDGMHVLYQYRSSGAWWMAVAAIIIAALAVFGIYLLTQFAYRIIEVVGPTLAPIVIVLVAGGILAAGIAAIYYLWKRRD